MEKTEPYKFDFIGRAAVGSILLCILLGLPSVTYSAALALHWDPPTVNSDGSPLVDLSHYRLYYGFESKRYISHIETNKPSATVSGLIAGLNYYFAVIAVNSNNVKSDFSNEYIWNSDSNKNSIPDSWETTFFKKTGGHCHPDADDDGDGYSNYQEFIAGSNPTKATDRPVSLSSTNNDLSFEFPAHMATGPGYEDLHRYYRLDGCTNLVTGAWTVIPGFDRIVATNQTVVYTRSLTSESSYCRHVTWLE